jgi:four helix bundle protein
LPDNHEREAISAMKDLKARTICFALEVIKLVESLPRSQASAVIGKQVLRSATSVGANYRAACRARSSKDFVSKMGIVEEEIDESGYWLELIEESGLTPPDALAPLRKEANELTAIVVASIRTAKASAERGER